MQCEDEKLEAELIRRLESRIDLGELTKLCDTDIVVAGGAILANAPNDYDVYAAHAYAPLSLESITGLACERKWKILGSTRNALTIQGDFGKVYQFCRYVKNTPNELIQSFDFAHCQVGVYAAKDNAERYVVLTDAFLRAMALEHTFFCGTEYPLSSMIRLVKYARRGRYGIRRDYMHDAVRILTEVLKRGFYDYDDFKDQMDAIDLGYAGEEAKELWKVVEQSLIRPRPTSTLNDCPF